MARLTIDDLRRSGRAEELFNSLSEAEVDALMHDWSFLARDEQLEPPGDDWAYWLYLAGRGAGKTRTGAEWVRGLVKRGFRRLGLIAPTAADVRDVMVEGESGLLSVCHAGDRMDSGVPLGTPVYEPTKRRVTWSNGAQCATYSADEPERLRGPQHEALWADELCLAEGTIVTTSLGPKKIEDVKSGMMVLTRSGYKKVRWACRTGQKMTNIVQTLSNSVVICTPNHPFLTQNGWKNAEHLCADDYVFTLNGKNDHIDELLRSGGNPCAPLCSERVQSVTPHTVQRVYNLEVEDKQEYFANGILVHNCAWRRPETWDLAMFGLRLGKNPRAFISTTPKPRKFLIEIMNDAACAVTKGSTYSNKHNLAPQFFRTIVKKYEGTRLGQQELEGLVLMESDEALWSRELLERTRRTVRHENMLRIVVGVDPAMTAKAESSETGLIVGGLGADKHGYVWQDSSGTYSPGDWAKRAVNLYHYWNADRIVAEGNQGGDLVAHTIQQIDNSVPVKVVHASRGKYARAEPIAASFERNEAHIVGSLSELEDQLCSWEPLSGVESPDRLDAMVWVLSECLIGKGVTAQHKLRNYY